MVFFFFESDLQGEREPLELLELGEPLLPQLEQALIDPLDPLLGESLSDFLG